MVREALCTELRRIREDCDQRLDDREETEAPMIRRRIAHAREKMLAAWRAYQLGELLKVREAAGLAAELASEYTPVRRWLLCEARDAWRRVQDGGVVEGGRVLFRVPFAITAAAFDRAGREVLIAGEAELWHLALDPEPRLLARFDPRPLRALVLGPEGRSRPRADALNAALCRHGTLLGVGDGDAAELARLNTASTFHEPKPLGLRRARTLAAHAQGVKRARKLPRLWPPK